MKSGPEENHDARLHQLLNEWQVTENLPPRFRQQVWHRLARAEAAPPEQLGDQWLKRLAGAFLRPSLAVSYVTALLLAGLLAGYWHARQDNAQLSQQLGSRYLQMMDPYQLAKAQ